MRLAFDATVFEHPPTGIAKATNGLYEGCFSLVPSLEITALHRKQLSSCFAPQIETIQWMPYVPQYTWRAFAIPLYAHKFHPSFIHFPWNGNIPRGLGKTKVIMTLHDVLPLIIPHYFKNGQSERKYRSRIQEDLNRSDVVITDSKYSKTQIQRNFIVKAELLVVPVSSTLQPCDEEPNVDRRSNFFLYSGGLHPRKGIIQLLNVFLTLYREDTLTSPLVLTGARSYFSTKVKQLIKEGLKMNAIKETGYVTDLELACLYSQALALVYPSRFEGFGLPPLEAMSLGCPVITTRCTAIPEVCGNAAYYIDLDNDQELAEGLIKMQNDESLRNKFVKMGRNQAKKFSWDKSARLFLDAISKADKG